MRPRVFPAEDVLQLSPWKLFNHLCFNEAAGIPRGRPAPKAAAPRCAAGQSFNEAAGIPRGRLSDNGLLTGGFNTRLQ